MVDERRTHRRVEIRRGTRGGKGQRGEHDVRELAVFGRLNVEALSAAHPVLGIYAGRVRREPSRLMENLWDPQVSFS